jgi:hypothetical protein
MTKREKKDALHVILGILIMFTIGFITDFDNYTTEGKYIGVPLVSLFLGLFIGFSWELYHWVQKGAYMDKNDIIRTAIGFLIGGLLATFI